MVDHLAGRTIEAPIVVFVNARAGFFNPEPYAAMSRRAIEEVAIRSRSTSTGASMTREAPMKRGR